MKTHVKQTYPWGLFEDAGHRLLCSDGVIRAAKLAVTADTFFSVPASIRIKGKYVSGYYTTEEQRYIPGEKTEPPFLTAHVFRHHDGQDDRHSLPAWPDSSDEGNRRMNALIEGAQ